MPFIHSPADGPDHVEVAALLVAMAEEAGIHTREILVTPHGFLIPEALYAQLDPAGAVVLSDPRDEGKTPPPGWDDPLEPVNVEQLEDGKFYLIVPGEAPAEVVNDDLMEALTEAMMAPIAEEPVVVKDSAIREWAIEQGLKVAAKGKLPQSVLDAFHAAHSE